MSDWIIWLAGDVVFVALLVYLDRRARRFEREADLAWRLLADERRIRTSMDLLALVDAHRRPGVPLRKVVAEMAAQLERGYPQ